MPRYSLTARINAAKRFHLGVEVVPGAETRGSDAYNPGCYVGHHTAGPKVGDRPSLNVVTNGRPGLSGPLANDFMPRRGGLVIVACGRSNNAGLGGFRGITGNSGTIGLEAEDDGDGVWTDAQWRDFPRIVASGLYLMGRDQTWYCSHRTWAMTPPSKPGRKIDPTGMLDAWVQAWAGALLRNPSVVPNRGMPGAVPSIPPKELDLPVTPTDVNAIWANPIDIPANYASAYARKPPRYTSEELLFSAQYWAQQCGAMLKGYIAASAARETAMLDIVTKLAGSTGLPVTRDELVTLINDSTERAIADLDLHLTAGTPAGTETSQ